MQILTIIGEYIIKSNPKIIGIMVLFVNHLSLKLGKYKAINRLKVSKSTETSVKYSPLKCVCKTIVRRLPEKEFRKISIHSLNILEPLHFDFKVKPKNRKYSFFYVIAKAEQLISAFYCYISQRLNKLKLYKCPFVIKNLR